MTAKSCGVGTVPWRTDKGRVSPARAPEVLILSAWVKGQGAEEGGRGELSQIWRSSAGLLVGCER